MLQLWGAGFRDSALGFFGRVWDVGCTHCGSSVLYNTIVWGLGFRVHKPAWGRYPVTITK